MEVAAKRQKQDGKEGMELEHGTFQRGLCFSAFDEKDKRGKEYGKKQGIQCSIPGRDG